MEVVQDPNYIAGKFINQVQQFGFCMLKNIADANDKTKQTQREKTFFLGGVC